MHLALDEKCFYFYFLILLLFCLFLLLSNLFLLQFMDPITLFDTIQGFHRNISANF